MENNARLAFPQQKTYTNSNGYKITAFEGGMYLRDVFMAAAMESGQCPFTSDEHEEAARWAGNRADAMIEERGKE